MSAARRVDPLPAGRLALVALFVTALVTAQLTAAKLLAFSLPFGLPVAGDTLVLPGAALAYALTFFASDCYSELYGERAARLMINVAFAMNFVLLALVWSTLRAPALPGQPVDPAAFERVLWSSAPVVLGSLLAYVLSQNWDVVAFHRLREYTDGDHLWLRNVGSTATSQAIDTVVFVTVAFHLGPRLLGGPVRTLGTVATLVVGQYVLKLLIAVLDTPFVYAVVGFLRERGHAPAATPAD